MEQGAARHGMNANEQSGAMWVNVTPNQYGRLACCVMAFENGARGPDGWTKDDVYDQLGYWAFSRGGNYVRWRHEAGEPVDIRVIEQSRA